MTTHQDPTDPAPFSDDELDELDRLDKAATPVPLEYHASEMLILPSPSAMTGGKRSGWCGEASSAAEGLALVSARNALPRLLSGYRALREENERLRANQSLDAAPELQRFPFRALAKTEPEDIDKLVTVCRMNAMASSPHVALTHLTIAGTLLALRDEVERLRVSIARCANEIENSAGVNSAPFADMVRKILEDSAK